MQSIILKQLQAGKGEGVKGAEHKVGNVAGLNKGQFLFN